MSPDTNTKYRIDFDKVKNIKDIKSILQTFNIEFLGPNTPKSLKSMLVQVSDDKHVINFARVKNIKDIKLILESLNIIYNAGQVSEAMRSMCVVFDENPPHEDPPIDLA